MFRISLNEAGSFEKLRQEIERLKNQGKDLSCKVQYFKEKEAKAYHHIKKLEKDHAGITQRNAMLECTLAKHMQLLDDTTEEVQLMQLERLNRKYQQQ